MHALFTRAAVAASLMLSAASAVACPLPSHTASTPYEKGAGYYWRTNSDGYAHLMVVEALISPQQKAGLRVNCSVMEETIMFGGRFAVVSIGRGGMAFRANVKLPGFVSMDSWDKANYKPPVWQVQSERIRSSTVAPSVAQILSSLHDRLLIDSRWDITFQQDDRGGNIVRSYATRVRAGSARDYRVTFVGDFRTPRAAKVIGERLSHLTMSMMLG